MNRARCTVAAAGWMERAWLSCAGTWSTGAATASLLSSVRYSSVMVGVCKTLIRRFDSDPRLQRFDP
jgi:hypothetical protein